MLKEGGTMEQGARVPPLKRQHPLLSKSLPQPTASPETIRKQISLIGQMARQRVVLNSCGGFPVPNQQREFWFVGYFRHLLKEAKNRLALL